MTNTNRPLRAVLAGERAALREIELITTHKSLPYILIAGTLLVRVIATQPRSPQSDAKVYISDIFTAKDSMSFHPIATMLLKVSLIITTEM